MRTEDKRRQIVRIAAEAFEEQGFDRVSMSEISKRVGGSKATLYGYFKSKEELLLATLDYDISEGADALMNQMLSAPSLRDGMIGLGIGYLNRRLGPRPISNVRIVSTQPEESGIGEIFYAKVLRPAWVRLSDRIEAMMDDGLFKRADPWIAAMQWKGLVELDLFDRKLLGAMKEIDQDEIRDAATRAADIFLEIYGTEVGKARGVKTPGQIETSRKGKTA